MINCQNFSDPPLKNKRTYEIITKVTTGQGDDHTTSCLLDYMYLYKKYKLIAIE